MNIEGSVLIAAILIWIIWNCGIGAITALIARPITLDMHRRAA